MLKKYQKARRDRRKQQNYLYKSMMSELFHRFQAQSSLDSGVGNDLTDDIVISLTSFHQRIDDVYLTIESLFQQSLKADKIILWLSLKNFPNGNNDLPYLLLQQRQRGLEINFVEEDIGPYKKIIYALKKFPDSIIITVDDDILYPVDLVEKLYRNYLIYPDQVHCNRAHFITYSKAGSVAPYSDWTKPPSESVASFKVFPTGNAGVLYPPEILHSDVTNTTLFMDLAPNADDIWLKAMSLRKQVKCQLVKDYRDWKSRFLMIQGSNASSLMSENKSKRGGNDDKLRALFDHFQLWDMLDS